MDEQPVSVDVVVGLREMPLAPGCFWCGEPLRVMCWTSEDSEWHLSQVQCPKCFASGPLPAKACGSELMAYAMAVSAFHKTRSPALADALKAEVERLHGVTTAPVKVPV
jgi:hypothetical protein